MSLEENKAIILRLVEALNNKDFDLIDDLISADYFDHLLPVRGLEAFKQYANIFLNAFPDLHRTVKDIIAEADKVWIRIEITGTQTGQFRGLAPTGKKITVPSVIIWRIANGKITERTQITDNADFYKQLGIVEYTEKGKQLFQESASQ